MSISTPSKTLVSIGHANHADSFQCGREAAQIAKSQLPAGPIDLIMVFSPIHLRMLDLIEGVRLVMGEDRLIGIPTTQVVTNGEYATEGAVVMAIQSTSHHFNLALSNHIENHPLVAPTKILSKIRSQRGNAFKEAPFRGLLAFDNALTSQSSSLDMLLSEICFGSWLLGCRLALPEKSPLTSKDDATNDGLVGIECLSQVPWGIEQVNIHAFKEKSGVHQEAVRSALRASMKQLQNHDPAFGFLFFNFPINALGSNDWAHIFQSAATVIGSTPLIGISTTYQNFRHHDRWFPTANDAITVVMGAA